MCIKISYVIAFPVNISMSGAIGMKILCNVDCARKIFGASRNILEIFGTILLRTSSICDTL